MFVCTKPQFIFHISEGVAVVTIVVNRGTKNILFYALKTCFIKIKICSKIKKNMLF